MFTDECDKLKDIAHIHSFAYDFYLREMQLLVNGTSPHLGAQYHLTAFLHDLITHYTVEPVFARNIVHEGMTFSISVDKSGCRRKTQS